MSVRFDSTADSRGYTDSIVTLQEQASLLACASLILHINQLVDIFVHPLHLLHSFWLVVI